MLPILPMKAQEPRPEFLTTVGIISVVNWYTMANEAVMRNRPACDKICLLSSELRTAVRRRLSPPNIMHSDIGTIRPR